MRRILTLLAAVTMLIGVAAPVAATTSEPWFVAEFESDPDQAFDGGWGLTSTPNGMVDDGALSRINQGAHWGSSYHWYPDSHGFGEPDELWLRYWVRFEEGFKINSPYRVKLPGFGGLYTYNCLGNRWSTPSAPCWSSRMTVSPIYTNDGLPGVPYTDQTLRLGSYAYLLNDSDAGEPDRLYPWASDAGLVEVGEWNCIEQQVVMNTPGVSDGIIRGFVNGEQAFEMADARMRRASESSLHVKSVWFDVYYGGSGTSPRDNRIVFDSVAAGPERTGCGMPEHVQRVAGPDRYATSAAALSQSSAISDRVFVASGETFPDAVVAGAAAAQEPTDGLLLTSRDSLPGPVRSELIAQDPSEVVVVGGPAVISSAVVDQISTAVPGAAILRWSGSDRYTTSVAVSEGLFPDPEPVTRVFIASGETFPDALAAAPAAGLSSSPVLLTSPTSLPPGVEAELRRLDPSEVIVAGGPAAVSDAVLNQIAVALPHAGIERAAGSNRTGTSIAIAELMFGDEPPNLVIATGTNFPDALSAAPFAAALDAPVLLLPSRDIPASAFALADGMYTVHGKSAEVFVVGGTAVIPDTIAALFDPS